MEGLTSRCPDADARLALVDATGDAWEATLRHLLACDACRAELDDLVRLRRAVTELPAASPVLVARVTDELMRLRPSPSPARSPARRRPKLAHALAAATSFVALTQAVAGPGATPSDWLAVALVSVAAGAILPRILARMALPATA